MLRVMDLRMLKGTGAALCALSCCAAVTPPARAATSASAAPTAMQTSVSANWAGYVVTNPAAHRPRFSSVSGSWTQPQATCAAGRGTDSAAWVGLGGYSERAGELEQVGTDADCTRSGSATYSSWYELLPAEPVQLKLTVHPGDTIAASVTTRGHHVTLRIRDLTTGRRFSVTKRVANIDASSAEWIVEAPSVCVHGRACEVLALTDFGQVAFASATAVSHSHTGAIDDGDWSATALELEQTGFTGARGRAGEPVLATGSVTVATPSPSGEADGAFSVSWQQRSVQPEGGAPAALPGFGGGPP